MDGGREREIACVGICVILRLSMRGRECVCMRALWLEQCACMYPVQEYRIEKGEKNKD